MTYEQFRSNPDFTKRFRELLNDPVMQQAIVILKDGRPPIDPSPSADALASVRALSQMVGADSAISQLLSFGEPLIPEPEDPAPDWGVPLEPVKPAI